jgi:UDP-glucose 4-epimerase
MGPGFQRALVTGGAGFIGSHLVRALLEQGVEVSVLDDLSVGKPENVPAAAKFVKGDVRDANAVDEALGGVDCVFHNAAVVSVRASVEGFVRDADVNLMGTLNLMDRLDASGVRKAVLASSMAVYADSEQQLAESHPTEPLSPYGIAKLAAERYWILMCRRFGIAATVLRYFNTYGPGQSFTPYVGVITIFINRLLAGEPLVIFGDGEQRRDFVHVDDIVAANLLALGANAADRIFNVGTAKPGEMRSAVADISAIRDALGFAPTRPEIAFEEIIHYWREAAGPS